MNRTDKRHRKRDPARWFAAGLAALALTGIGAMHAHVLMLRRGLDLLPAVAQAGGVILLAAIPIGYLVYRFWFADRTAPLIEGPVGTRMVAYVNADNDDESDGYCLGPFGYGLYYGGMRVDDDWDD